MKKALSLMLTVVLLLTMAVPVFAVDATTSASEAWTGTTETPATTTPTTPVTTETPAVTTPAPVATQGQVTYTVKAGDVFWKIAKDNGLTTAQLTALNPAVKNPSVINVGDVIIVKAGTTTGTTPVVTPVASTGKLYLGAGMVPNYRDRNGNDNLNVTTASVVFDEAGKIVSLQWDVLEITKTMFNWIPAPAADDTVAKAAKADAITAILDWETKREEGFAYDMTHKISKGAADNLTKKEWFEQLDYFEEFFTGKTLGEVQVWFMRYTDINGRPFKLAYPEKLTELDKVEIANFTEAEKEMLIDVTTSATMSLQDGHSYFIDALVKAWYDREEIK